MTELPWLVLVVVSCGAIGLASGYVARERGRRFSLGLALGLLFGPLGLLGTLLFLREPQEAEETRPSPARSSRGVIIAAMGLLGALLTALATLLAQADASEYGDLSAIQITQRFSEGTFWMLGAVALLLFGILPDLSDRR